MDTIRTLISTLLGQIKSSHTDSGSRRHALVPRLESLENRQLMAANVYVDDTFANPIVGQDPDGAGPATEFGVDAFATIQEGVDAVDVGGAVNINPGNYSESVAVAKNLTLDGTSGVAGDVVIDPAVGNGISISAGNVVVRDLMVQDAEQGIGQTGGGDLTLDNVHVVNNTDNGIDSLGVGSIELTNVHATGNGVDGVVFEDVLGSVRIVGGNFSNNGDDGAAFTNVDGAVEVDGGTFEDNGDDGLRFFGGNGAVSVTAGAFTNNGDDGLLIRAQNGDVAVAGGAFEANDEDGVDIEEVVGDVSIASAGFNNSGDDGVEVDRVTGNVDISGGTYSNNGQHGVELENIDGTISLSQAVIDGNDGAGVFVQHAAAFNDIDSVIVGNADHGIELIDVAGDATLTRTTLEDNDADNDGVGDGLNVASSIDLPFEQVDGITADASNQLFVADGFSLFSLPASSSLPFSNLVGSLDHFSGGLAFDGTNLLSASTFDNRLHTVDPGNASTLASVTITHSGETLDRVEGLAVHPSTGEIYALLRFDGRNTTELVTVDRNSGVATSIGDTGNTFAEITFDSAGTLYGVTSGSSFAVMPETLFTLSTVDASSTPVLALPRGGSGEAIAFNPGDGLIYNSSRSGGGLLLQLIDPAVPEAQVLNFGVGGDLTIAGATLRNSDGQGGTAHQQRGVFVGASVLGDVRLESSSGIVQAVEVTGHEQNGVDINGAASVTITGGVFSNNDSDGIEVDDSGAVTLTDIVVEENGRDGVELRRIGDILVTGARVDANRGDGLRSDGREGTTTILGGSFSGNASEGVDFGSSSGGAVQLTDVTADDNGASGATFSSFAYAVGILRGSYSGNDNEGIRASGTTQNIGDFMVTDVVANGNRSGGLWVEGLASLSVQGGSFSDNLRPNSSPQEGIFAYNVSGGVTLTGATVQGNSGPGVRVELAGTFSDSDGIITDNGNHGIELLDITGDVTLVRTTLEDNDADNDGVGDGLNSTDDFDADSFAIGGNLSIEGATIRDSDGNPLVVDVAHQQRGVFVDGVGGSVTFADSTGVVQSVTVTGHDDDGVDILNVHGDVDFVGGIYSDNDSDGIKLEDLQESDNIDIIGVTVERNDGDGIDIERAEDVDIEFSIVSDNGGNGITLEHVTDDIEIFEVTIHGNAEGGLRVDESSTVEVSDSTLSNNQQRGATIDADVLTIVNSTISGNETIVDGAGVHFTGTDLAVSNSTISGNRADSDGNGNGTGAGIFIQSASTRLLTSSIVAGNVSGAIGSDSPSDVSGIVDAASSFNLIGSGDGLTGVLHGVNNNQVGSSASPIDPRLGPLQDNGGPTQTHELLSNSPAIDTGSNSLNLQFDQRGAGFLRTQGSATDIGAFEAEPAVNVDPTTPVDVDPSANVISEGAATGTSVGITVESSDVDGPSLSYHLTDNAGGRFAINPNSGVVTVANGALLDGPTTHTITVEARDGAGGTASAAFDIDVNNVVATITSLTSSNPDLANKSTDGNVTISGSFSDPAGPLDSHSVRVDFGDGSPVRTLSSGVVDQNANTFSLDHAYTSGGIFTITVTVLDDEDGGDSATATTTAVVSGVGLVDGVLHIIGTDGGDTMIVSQPASQIRVATRLYGQSWQTFSFNPADVHSIRVLACGGNDRVVIRNELGLLTSIDGGSGDDLLAGGSGSNLIAGGSGNDRIYGGSGRDLLIGGTGRDRIDARSGEDVLIHGTTNQDGNQAALMAALSLWRSDDSYESRSAGIESLIGAQDDAEGDQLVGNGGRDLFFAALNDNVFAMSNELVHGLV